MISVKMQAQMIANDVAEFYMNGELSEEDKIKIDNICNNLIKDHQNDLINIFDYNDDKFYEWFVSVA